MSTSAETPEALVFLRGLVKRFGSRTALGPLDLTLERCEIVAVVGPDAAGKTTLLRSLAGLLEVEATEARVLGYDLRGDVTDLKREIGYAPQTFSLHRDLSVIENLRFTARLQRLAEAEFRRRAERLLEHTGLAPFRDRQAGALSGGMKQKLAVANALLLEPRLILLDEPTAGVDVTARAEIWTMLAAQRARALVVMSTSYLDEAAACDRLVYLDRGRVVAVGSPHDLRTGVSLELFRVWGEEPKSIARGARALPYVWATRACAGYARVEVVTERSPGDAAILSELVRLPNASFAERTMLDMESTLIALGRRAAASGTDAPPH